MPDELSRLSERLSDRYRIERELGSGGMATVYLARDLKHDREVAIKVIHPELALAMGPERFLREVQIAAQLTHPHIVPLFDSGEADGLLYYVMPFVEGESLRDRLDREKQLPLDEALRLAREVADALSYAHGQDVVHRDIKPENILLESGHAVVADFGLARAITEAGGDKLTKTGMVLGTPTYMSPEQAAGERQVDGRSDLYSLACVLYEMLAGMPPFVAPTQELVLAQHVSEPPPPVTKLRPIVPDEVAGVLARALAKSPADRFSPVAQFAVALRESGETTAARPSRGGRGRTLAIAIAAGLLVIAAAATVGVLLRGAGGPAPVPQPRQLTFTGDVVQATLSPAGDFLAYLVGEEDGTERLMVQEIGGNALELHSHDFMCCAQWSPDGSQILFRAGTRTDGRTLLLPRLGGGTPRELNTEIITAWSPDGSRIVSWWPQSESLWLTDVESGDTTGSIPLEMPHVWVPAVDWSPAEDLLAVITQEQGISTLWTVSVDDGVASQIFSDSVLLMSPKWAPGGGELYYLRGPEFSAMELWKIGLAAGEMRDPPGLVRAGLSVQTMHQAVPAMSLSADGSRLVYTERASYSNLWAYEIGPQGSLAPRALTSGTAARWNPRISPDGRTVAFVETVGADQYIAALSVGGEEPQSRLTFGGEVWGPAWSGDGRWIAYGSEAGGEPDVWLVPAAGGTPRRIAATRFDAGNRLAWAPGDAILYQLPDDRNYHLLDPETEAERPLLPGNSNGWLYDPRTSPDGKSIAVYWNRMGDVDDGVWIISIEDGSTRLLQGGFQPLDWSSDGTIVYAIVDAGAQREIYALPLSGEEPTLYATMPFASTSRHLTLTPDGRLIVAAVEESQADAWLIENFDPGRR